MSIPKTNFAAEVSQFAFIFITQILIRSNLPIKKQSQASAYEGRQIVIGSTQLTEVPQSANAFALKNIGGDLHIGGYDAKNIKALIAGEVAYESIRFDTADMLAAGVKYVGENVTVESKLG